MGLILRSVLNVCTDVALRLRSYSIGKRLPGFIFAVEDYAPIGRNRQ
jgi:hypothetical protein